MATLTPTGIEPTDLTAYVEQLETLFRTIFGQDLNLAAETPQGQMAGALGLFFANIDEVAVHGANGLSLFRAVGLQLDDIGALFSNPRIQGEQSTVTATLTGQAGTIVQAGARARTPEGAVFASDVQAIIGATGTVEVLFRATEEGQVQAAAGELTQIIDVIAGWTGITNAADAQLGRTREADLPYQRRYRTEVAVHARDALEAVRARVLEVDGVTDARTHDNDTTAEVTRQGIAIPAGALLVIVEGGADADIAHAIAQTKGAGIPTTGDQAVVYTQPNGTDITIRFRRVENVPIEVTATLLPQAGFPSTGLATMRQNLLQWFVGEWPTPAPGFFDQSGIGIGEVIDTERIRTPLNAVPNHRINSLVVQRADNSALGTPNLDQRYTLDTANITLTLQT